MFRITAAQTGPNEFAISVADVVASRYQTAAALTRQQVEAQFQIPAILLRVNDCEEDEEPIISRTPEIVKTDTEIMLTIQDFLEGLQL